jgi:hypothetical protein
MNIDFDELTKLRNEWYAIFDGIIAFIEGNGEYLPIGIPIFDHVKVGQCMRVQMRLHSMYIRTGLLIDKHIVMEHIDESTGEIREILVSRAFEAKAFGDIKYAKDVLQFILRVLNLYNNNNNNNATMAKVENFKKGAPVSTVKLNGEKFLGVYEHGYDNGQECCVSGADGKKYCVKLKSTKEANEEESKIIQETIIKPRREAEKARKKALEAAEQEEEKLTEEDLEEAVAEPTEEELTEAMEASETTEE